MTAQTRTAVTMGSLVVLFIVGTVVGFQLLTAEAPKLASESDTPTCEPRTIESGSDLGAEQITINLYNASTSSGLATRTLNALEKRGFMPGDLGNAPDSVKRVGNVVISGSDRKSAAVRLVARQFKGEVTFRKPQEDAGSGVSVILGRKFDGLKKKAPTTITAKKATEVCVLVDPTVPDDES